MTTPRHWGAYLFIVLTIGGLIVWLLTSDETYTATDGADGTLVPLLFLVPVVISALLLFTMPGDES